MRRRGGGGMLVIIIFSKIALELQTTELISPHGVLMQYLM